MRLPHVLIASSAAAVVASFPHAAEPARPSATEEVVALSPFTVSDTDDKSWQATTTLIGSRTNQELIKVPVNVDVITSEFMRDLGRVQSGRCGAVRRRRRRHAAPRVAQ
jgi:ABC-type Fe2+-enterobactin transport system substrate-binding protein